MEITGTKKTVVMQPTCLPWLGYFDLIDQADVFVFLDIVQFEKQSWQQRNRIMTHKGLEWITIPALIKGRFGQSIKEVQINQSVLPGKFLRQIQTNYSRAEYFKEYFDEFCAVFTKAYSGSNLCDFNVEIIRWFCDKISLPAHFVRSSQLKASGKRTELLVNILKELDSDEYLSPAGSSVYLEKEGGLFQKHGIALLYHHYVHPEYRQVYKPFAAYASCIDLLFNEGPRSLEIIRLGRKDPSVAEAGADR